MGARRHVAVALIVPAPVGTEIDVLRRALDDRQLGRIEPHITIIPPINLRDDALTEAMVLLDRVAARHASLPVSLGPVAGFGPGSRTRFLRVDPWDAVTALHEDCWQGPFDRPRQRTFHPHVTIDIDGAPEHGDDPAAEILAGYSAEVTFDRLTLLENVQATDGQGDGRRWEPFCHYPLTGERD